jgi:acetyl-CoA carboxylase biotin carboxyl carrier protein
MAGDREELAAIVELLAAATFSEFRLETPDVKIVVRRSAGDAAPDGGIVQDDPVAEAAGHVVTAPLLGVFQRAAQPGGPPLAEVGDTVNAAAELCIVEVLGRPHRVSAGFAGIVSAVLAADGAFVEFGAPLFAITPAA